MPIVIEDIQTRLLVEWIPDKPDHDYEIPFEETDNCCEYAKSINVQYDYMLIMPDSPNMPRVCEECKEQGGYLNEQYSFKGHPSKWKFPNDDLEMNDLVKKASRKIAECGISVDEFESASILIGDLYVINENRSEAVVPINDLNLKPVNALKQPIMAKISCEEIYRLMEENKNNQ